MPISSSVIPLLSARKHWISFLLLLAPLFFQGQTLTGLWTGALHNDSNSVRKDQSFEIALTEYKGKVFGYSRSEFIVNDTLYYIVKRVKGVIEGDICEVKDDEIIAYNFRGKLDKGIKVSSTFRRSQTDSTWRLDGDWKTNATKKYYSVTGKVKLAEEKDLSASKLFPHLEELNKADELAFYKERTESAPFVKVAKPDRIESDLAEKADFLAKNDEKSPVVKKPELPKPVQPAIPVVTAETALVPTREAEKPVTVPTPAAQTGKIEPPVETAVAKKEITPVSAEKSPVLPQNQSKPAEKSPVLVKNDIPAADIKPTPVVANTEKANAQPVAVNTQPVKEAVPAPALSAQSNNTKPAPEKVVAKSTSPVVNPVPEKETPKATVSTKPATQKPAATEIPSKTTPIVASNNPVKETPVAPAVNNKSVLATPVENNLPKQRILDPAALLVKKSAEDPIKKSTMIGGRKSEFSQEVYFKSDSLILTLYDNGEIDGDTVSVYLNGEVVMPSQGLKSSAIRKTIHMDDGLETFTLVMFAESLGKYPPNTGLLVIRDGNDVYNLRFSSDFQKSSGIVFRRKQ
jgi:hypothetical protein